MARPGFEPHVHCSASQELNHYTRTIRRTAVCETFYHHYSPCKVLYMYPPICCSSIRFWTDFSLRNSGLWIDAVSLVSTFLFCVTVEVWEYALQSATTSLAVSCCGHCCLKFVAFESGAEVSYQHLRMRTRELHIDFFLLILIEIS